MATGEWCMKKGVWEQLWIMGETEVYEVTTREMNFS